MDTSEFKKSIIFTVAGMATYGSQGRFMKSILKKETGHVNAVLMAKGEHISEGFSRFDHFIHIIEGSASVQIDDNLFTLMAGECIIIPAHSKNTVSANERFIMISTIIKSGYE
ncbi:cupin [Gelidibacter salicanalis]|uniref:Cupin n=1 Tax=Gelidibacter salicanalis TaxID=291193 RepID=A0A5C7APP7_9FLAO|nr:cupin [Gelidibacter salicanalis]TXE07792.1 cupin [Gelidibacter salicanalis]